MAFEPKFAAPAPPPVEYLPRVLASAVEGRTSFFAAAPGYLPTSQIAAALSYRKMPTLWVRLGREDADPGILLTSLMDAAEQLSPKIGQPVRQQMLKKPGPVNGWAPLFTLLAHEMKTSLPDSCALVVEHLQNLPSGTQALELLGGYFLPMLPDDRVTILSSHTPLQPGVLPLSVVVHNQRELRLDQQSALAQSRAFHAVLPDKDILRLHTLADGRPSLLMTILKLVASTDPEVYRRAIEQARSFNDLLIRLARAWLNQIPSESQESTLLAVRLEYLHPSLGNISGDPAWLQHLDGDWSRIQCSWNLPLSQVLPARGPTRDRLLRAADYLSEGGAVEQAVPVYLEAGATARAAQVLSGSVKKMIDLGQWQTLDAWLSRIPEKDLSDWPWLIYARGEIQTSRQDLAGARRSFSLSTGQFRRKQDSQGVCQSLLTESAVALWHGEKTLALNLALSAQAEARNTGLPLYQAYAAWQLGCLYAVDELYTTALLQFQEVLGLSAQNQDEPMAALSARAVALLQMARELQQQNEVYRQALEQNAVSRQETTGSILQMVSTPAANLGDFLSDRGWWSTPLNLKVQPLPPARTADSGLSGLWQTLLAAFGIGLPRAAQPVAIEPLYPAIPITSQPVEPVSLPAAAAEARVENEKGESPERQIVAYLLGPFEVKIDGQPVLGWSGGRGRAIFQYLITYHQRPRTREAIMDVFWQEASPESARNNLNVALYSLRGSLRSATTLPVVRFEDGFYRINPQFHLWLDVDEFERFDQLAQQREQAGDVPGTIEACEAAIQMYKDDFLSEFPFEEWAVLPRERLRIKYMDLLDRLSRIYLKQGEYVACSRLCLMMLDRDRCWEDAHTRLMRCYVRQGNYELAIRQYQACQESLREELNIEPSEDTEQLYLKIRRREAI